MHDTRASWISATLIGLFTLLQLGLALWSNDGHFVYALDDPYIHLDLARQLATTGIYGLNPGEYAAPSSSILWPLLLAPFALTPAFIYIPFIIGLISAMAGAAVISFISPKYKIAAGVAGALALNLPALALMGMEHGLHVLLSLLAMAGCLRVLGGKKPQFWLWLVIIIHPLIRYEGVLISAAVLGILFWHGYRRQTLITLLLMCLPVAAFTLFLHLHGLGYVPGSTIVKKLRFDAGDGTFWNFWLRSIVVGLRSPSGIALVCATLVAIPICLLRVRAWRSPRYAVLLAISGVLAGHLLLGRLSTFESPRYDLYAIAFIVPLALWLLQGRLRVASALFTILLAIPGLWSSGYDIQNAIRSVYQQQYQMQRLVQDYWHDPVAVNDIGLVGLGTDAYVLDLIGLANADVRIARTNNVPGWADAFVRQHNVPLIMIYRSWHKPEEIGKWVTLGELFRTAHSTLGDDSVLLLTPYPDRAANIRAILRDWAKDLPAGAHYAEYAPEKTVTTDE